MNDIPNHIGLIFIACVIATFGFIYFGVRFSTKKSYLPTLVLTLISFWLLIIGVVTVNGYFLNFDSIPPRLMVFAAINLLIIILLFSLPRSRNFISQIPITTLTHIHIIRVPVEIVLWWLFLEHLVPQELTYEGANFDIISGITAPFAAIFLVGKKRQNRLWAVLWNVAALGLLINIVSRAIMNTPYFISPTAELPNLAVFYFPFVYLPLFVVPAVLFAHLTSLYQLSLNSDRWN
ncbi:hypothetical protein [Marinoscillum sp. MHG1-6]|uniref:hypothetical protein n=1 Tax=Marinoscillum sp. MHG1-6 TaxID=2959627 RepID=UPI002157F422|nr:hypothetical protein [Marinoscillum sp. MHG1-6]